VSDKSYTANKELFERADWENNKCEDWNAIPTKEFRIIIMKDINILRAVYAANYLKIREANN